MTELAFVPPAKPVIGDGRRAAGDRVMRSGRIAPGLRVVGERVVSAVNTVAKGGAR